MRRVISPEGHRFFEESEPYMCQGRSGRWVVRYRDHHTVKQDLEFNTEAEAKYAAFRWRLTRGVFDPEVDGGCAAEVAQYWGLEVSYAHAQDAG